MTNQPGRSSQLQPTGGNWQVMAAVPMGDCRHGVPVLQLQAVVPCMVAALMSGCRLAGGGTLRPTGSSCPMVTEPMGVGHHVHVCLPSAALMGGRRFANGLASQGRGSQPRRGGYIT